MPPREHHLDHFVLPIFTLKVLLGSGLFQAPGRQHGFEVAALFARLRGVRFVDDDGEALARQCFDLLGDDREFLQGGDNDALAVFQRLLELARGAVDALDQAGHLLEVADVALQLAIQHAPVGDDDDRVEDRLIFCIVQCGKLVREPGDGEGFAAARAVLDEVTPACALIARIRQKAAHGIELVVAGEDQDFLAGGVTLIVRHGHDVDKMFEQVQDTVTCPSLFPEISGGEAPRRARGDGIARSAVAPLVEGEEDGVLPAQMRGEPHLVRVYGEVREAAPEGQQRLLWIAARGFVLVDGVVIALPGEGILEFHREEGDAVEEQPHIQALAVFLALVLDAVGELADDGEDVVPVLLLQGGVERAGRAEEDQAELRAAILDALAQHIQRAAFGDLLG